MPAYVPVAQPRPIGVTILGVLTILVGIFVLLVGVLALLAAIAFYAVPGGLGFGTLFAVLAVLVILFGLLWVLAGFGLLKLRPWAWWLAVIVSVLNILYSAGTLPGSAITLAVSILILVYLVTVRRHFGGPRPVGA
jgi:hypothetical protein